MRARLLIAVAVAAGAAACALIAPVDDHAAGDAGGVGPGGDASFDAAPDGAGADASTDDGGPPDAPGTSDAFATVDAGKPCAARAAPPDASLFCEDFDEDAGYAQWAQGTITPLGTTTLGPPANSPPAALQAATPDGGATGVNAYIQRAFSPGAPYLVTVAVDVTGVPLGVQTTVINVVPDVLNSHVAFRATGGPSDVVQLYVDQKVNGTSVGTTNVGTLTRGRWHRLDIIFTDTWTAGKVVIDEQTPNNPFTVAAGLDHPPSSFVLEVGSFSAEGGETAVRVDDVAVVYR